MWTVFALIGVGFAGLGVFGYSRIRRKHGGLKAWRQFRRQSKRVVRKARKRDRVNAAGRRAKQTMRERTQQAVARAKADAAGRPLPKKVKKVTTYGDYRPCNQPLKDQPGRRPGRKCKLHTPGGRPCHHHSGVLSR